MICALVAAPTLLAGAEWPGLRGPNFDGSAQAERLYEGDSVDLRLGWSTPIGSGYSSVSVASGQVVTMHVGGENDVISAFDVETGKERWRYTIGKTYVGHDGSHDGPITTPLISGSRIFGLGAWGTLFAVNAENGKEVWRVDIAESYGAPKPFYGFSASPVLLDGVLVVELGAPEGKAIGGFNPATGELLWSLGDDEVQYQSPIIATVDGQRQVIAIGNTKIFGIDASKGEIIWEHEHGGSGGALGVASAIPVPSGDGRFLIKNSSDGSAVLQVTNNDGVYEVSEVWTNNSFRGSYVTPVYKDGYYYGITGRVFSCVDAATGELKWRSREPGDGFPTLVGDHIVIITKPGSLHVIDASPEGYNESAQLDLFEEHSWSEVAFADGHLFARSMNALARIDLGAREKVEAPQTSWLSKTKFGAFISAVDTAESDDAKKTMVDSFMAEQKSFPIVENPSLVHFVFRGDAKDVGIVGDLIGFRREDPMIQLPGTDLFFYSARVEPNAAGTYGFIVDYAEPAADPLNDRAASGLFGDVSFFSMPGWKGYAYAADSAKPGKMVSFEWKSAVFEDKEQKAEIWLPADYDSSKRYPVVYVHDAKAALEQGMMHKTLNHVVGHTVDPMIAVFVYADEEDPRASRSPEYTTMIVDELIPAIDSNYSTIASREGRATVGSGGAANVALAMAFTKHDLFGGVGAQSANLGFFGPVTLDEMATGVDDLPMNVYLDWGTYHLRSPHEAWDMAADSRKGWSMLRERGYHPTGGERPEGFGWMVWRTNTDELLAGLFPKYN
jgi:enterochelin esterase-like enzyme